MSEQIDLEKSDLSKDGTVEVRISSDKMEAYIIITPSIGDGEAITFEKALNAIKGAGVVYGINEEAVTNAVNDFSGNPELIARGEPAIPGKDSEIKFLFSETEKKISPTVMDDGSVDLRDIGSIANVEAGEKLVQKIPPEEGTPGKTVTGLEVEAKKGKDLKLFSGKNTTISDDGTFIVATAPGRPALRQNKFFVEPVYRVTGNVDYSTGNINFVGSVVVRGWVKDGFSIKAGGDIEVDQGVDDAFLESGGNINVKYGIQGGEHGRISAKDNIKAGYIYNSLVFSGGDIKVRESIMHSKVYADKRVLVEGGKSLIVGGLIRAGELVTAHTIGSSLAQPTTVEVGINPAMREELINLDHVVEAKHKSLDQTKKAIDMLMGIKKTTGRLAPDKERMLIRLRHTLVQLEEEIAEARDRKNSIEEQLSSVQNPKIKVSGRVHPGVKIIIRGSVLFVQDPLNCVTLYEQDKEVVVGSYR